MNNTRIKSILFSERDIDGIVSELEDKINSDYKDCEYLVILCVLKGAAVFAADLMRKISIPNIRLEFIKASSYGLGDKSSGDVKISSVLPLKLENADVLVLEDIVDTGNTLSRLCGELEALNPKSLKVCGLFDKPARRQVSFEADYIGKVIPDEFIVGYGLDYGEMYRNLPYVAVLEVAEQNLNLILQEE